MINTVSLKNHNRQNCPYDTSTEDEKQLDSLWDVCKSAQDVLQKQKEQEMTIKKCRNKVDCMTDEMKMFQRITTKNTMLKQVSNKFA